MVESDMETEIEAKFPDIDVSLIRAGLKNIGAVREHPEVLMRRKNFDYPDWRLEKIGGWVRVRDEVDKITLSYKQLNDRTLHGTKEVSVEVSDFEETCKFLGAIGMEVKSYQETKREKWRMGDVEIDIDTWPWVPTFLEVETPTEEKLRKAVEKLGLDWKEAMHGSVENIYQKYYDFSEPEINHWSEIRFISPPDWLLKRKK